MPILYQLKIFYHLIKTDMIIFKKNIFGGMIDTLIWTYSLLFVVSHLYTKMGMSPHYGAIYLAGTIISCTIFEVESEVTLFLSDIEGNNTIKHHLTMPIPSWLVIAKHGVSCALKSMTFAIILIPAGKLFLQSRLDLSLFSPVKFLIMFVSIGLFGGAMSLLMASLIKSISHLDTLFFRFLLPLWFFGGSSFPWQAVYTFNPKVAYATLINPVIYASEGIKAATLGQQGYLNFWFCLSSFSVNWKKSFFPEIPS